RSSAEHGEAVAGEVDDVDVGGAQGNALFQNAGAFVHQGIDAALDDFLVADLARSDAQFLAAFLDHAIDLGVGEGIPPARLIAVEASAGLLAEAAHFAQPVGDDHALHVRVLGIVALADGPADVATGQVRHAQRAHD